MNTSQRKFIEDAASEIGCLICALIVSGCKVNIHETCKEALDKSCVTVVS